MEDRLGTQIQQGPNSVFVLKSVLDVRLSKQKKKKNLQGVPLTREPPAQAPLPASLSLLQSPVRIASLPTSVSHCPAVLGTPLPDFAAYSSKLSHPHGSWESLTPQPQLHLPCGCLTNICSSLRTQLTCLLLCETSHSWIWLSTWRSHALHPADNEQPLMDFEQESSMFCSL